MAYNNKYNILDKIISNFRSREIKKNFNLKNKKILDFGCGPNFKDLEKRYSLCYYWIINCLILPLLSVIISCNAFFS